MDKIMSTDGEQTDGQTDRQTKRQMDRVKQIHPPNFICGVITSVQNSILDNLKSQKSRNCHKTFECRNIPLFVLPWYLNTLQQNLWLQLQSRVHKKEAKVQSPLRLVV